ncbi:hypothetical protein [Kitasatospora griseola]
MVDEDGHFGERAAEQYDSSSAPELQQETVERTADVLADSRNSRAADGRW